MKVIIISLLFVACVFDLKNQRVPNVLSLALLVAALLWLMVWAPKIDIQNMVMSLGLTLLLTLPGYWRNAFGGADIKVLLVLALILPWQVMMMMLLTAFVIFILYWALFYRSDKSAPFIPAVFSAFVLTTYFTG